MNNTKTTTSNNSNDDYNKQHNTATTNDSYIKLYGEDEDDTGDDPSIVNELIAKYKYRF